MKVPRENPAVEWGLSPASYAWSLTVAAQGHRFANIVPYSSKLLLAIVLTAPLLGCKSTDQPQFADIGGVSAPAPAPDVTATASPAPRLAGPTGTATGSPTSTLPQTTPARGSAKIIIKGTKAGTTQDDIAVAL